MLFFNQQATMDFVAEAMPEVIEEKPVFDYSKVVVGVGVTHAKFGDGTIINIDKAQKYVKVDFGQGEKTSVFPSAFEMGFLEIK